MRLFYYNFYYNFLVVIRFDQNLKSRGIPELFEFPSSTTASHLLPLYGWWIKKEERDECLRNHRLDCSFVPEKRAGRNHLFAHGKWSVKRTRSHKRWCNRCAPIKCEMQSTPIGENTATRALGRRRCNDAFSSPSALFQGYYKSNGESMVSWCATTGLIMSPTPHPQFPLSCCLMKSVGEKY